MVTKYVITMTHHTCLGEENGMFYYAGEMNSHPMFDYRKARAKRYLWEYEAIHDMNILKVMCTSFDIFEVVAIRCRA